MFDRLNSGALIGYRRTCTLIVCVNSEPSVTSSGAVRSSGVCRVVITITSRTISWTCCKRNYIYRQSAGHAVYRNYIYIYISRQPAGHAVREIIYIYIDNQLDML